MKILVVFTGGTIGSANVDGRISIDAHAPHRLFGLYEKYAKEHGVCDDVFFEAYSPFSMHSENTTCATFMELFRYFRQIDFGAYDGVVMTCGTDAIQYTAAFMQYVFGDVGIPIVIVSANYVLDDARSNGAANFYYAVRFIRVSGGGGVFVSYKNSGEPPKIHMALRVLEHQAYSDDIRSIFDLFYGYFKDGMFVRNENDKGSESLAGADAFFNGEDGRYFLEPKEGAQSGVIQIRPYPGMRYPRIDGDVKAVLHYTYHSGTICAVSPDLKNFAMEAKEKNVPVFVSGADAGSFYESEKCYDELGFVLLPPAPPPAMYVKLWLCAVGQMSKDEMIFVMTRQKTGLADENMQ